MAPHPDNKSPIWSRPLDTRLSRFKNQHNSHTPASLSQTSSPTSQLQQGPSSWNNVISSTGHDSFLYTGTLPNEVISVTELLNSDYEPHLLPTAYTESPPSSATTHTYCQPESSPPSGLALETPEDPFKFETTHFGSHRQLAESCYRLIVPDSQTTEPLSLPHLDYPFNFAQEQYVPIPCESHQPVSFEQTPSKKQKSKRKSKSYLSSLLHNPLSGPLRNSHSRHLTSGISKKRKVAKSVKAQPIPKSIITYTPTAPSDLPVPLSISRSRKRSQAPDLFIKPEDFSRPAINTRKSGSRPGLLIIKVRRLSLYYLKLTGTFPLEGLPSNPHPRRLSRTDLIDIIYPGYLEGNMAPGYRTQNSRRQNRTGYVDHDVFEGLPVRQWRRDYVTVAPPPEQDNTKAQNDIWAVELPHGMPKDSHLLPQHSQDLLRAARSGRIYKRPAPAEEEEQDPEVQEKPEKKDDEAKDRGFSAKAWKQIPRQQEGAEIEYLAKRRKGLVTYTKPAAPIPTVVKTTVRRTDAMGNQYTQDVVVAHGQQVDGDIVAQTVIPDPNLVAAAESFAPQPTPPKRNRPVQKKRLKGPGRGRKKKVLPPTSVSQIAAADGVIQAVQPAVGAVGLDPIKVEAEGSVTPGPHEDTEMGEGSMAASDEEDGDEDGEEGDDDDGSVGDQDSPSKPPRSTSPLPALPTMKEIPDIAPASGMIPPIHPFAAHLERERSEGKSGSPLKNIVMTTSTLSTPLASPAVSAPPPLSFPDILPTNSGAVAEPVPVVEAQTVENSTIESLEDAMQIDVIETAPKLLPSPPANPTAAEMSIAQEVTKEEEEEEMMLLDMIDNANNAQVGGPKDTAEAPPTTFSEIPAEAVPALVVPEAIVAETAMPEPAALTPQIEQPLDSIDSSEPIQSVESVDSAEPLNTIEEPILKVEQNETPDTIQQVVPVEPTITESIQSIVAEILNPLQVQEPEPPIAEEEEDEDFLDLLGGLEKSLGAPAPAVVQPDVNAEAGKEEEEETRDA